MDAAAVTLLFLKGGLKLLEELNYAAVDRGSCGGLRIFDALGQNDHAPQSGCTLLFSKGYY